MAKTNGKKELVSLNIIQQIIKQIADMKISTMMGKGLQKAIQGKMFYKASGDNKLDKGIRASIFKMLLISALGNKKESLNGFSLNFFIEFTRAIAVNSSRRILNNLAKAGLISPLVDSGVASVEAVYLLIRGKANKRGALNHILNEASGSISSGVSLLGTLAILRALAYIPTPGRIAILILVKIAFKKFRNRL